MKLPWTAHTCNPDQLEGIGTMKRLALTSGYTAHHIGELNSSLTLMFSWSHILSNFESFELRKIF